VAQRQIFRPLRAFLSTETAGGILAVGAAIAALVWANAAPHSYESLWSTDIAISLGNHVLELDMKHWVNDGLMALFFLVVGLEIKRELVQGELRVLRQAMLPIAAAFGGMLVPAGLFAIINIGQSTVRGWGVPMATDIALAVGVMALVGRDLVPASLSLFLLAVAIVDDIGAIVVIALFYGTGIKAAWLAVGCATVIVTLLMRRLGISSTWPYVLAGVTLWLALHEAGVHATIAGVIMGLLAPTTARLSPGTIDEAELLDLSTPQAARTTATLARHSVSVVERLEYELHPVTSFVIVPLFALSNAGIRFDRALFDGVLSSRVFWGIVIGLVVGKPVGITLASWIAVRFRVAELPSGVRFPQIAAVGAVAGIGFTVSLFVADLAFGRPDTLGQAKVAVLVASISAGIIGIVALRASSRRFGQN
jgi:NhaA family Na+:H+ antiporter